jgi:hypothetical protein
MPAEQPGGEARREQGAEQQREVARGDAEVH